MCLCARCGRNDAVVCASLRPLCGAHTRKEWGHIAARWEIVSHFSLLFTEIVPAKTLIKDRFFGFALLCSRSLLIALSVCVSFFSLFSFTRICINYCHTYRNLAIMPHQRRCTTCYVFILNVDAFFFFRFIRIVALLFFLFIIVIISHSFIPWRFYRQQLSVVNSMLLFFFDVNFFVCVLCLPFFSSQQWIDQPTKKLRYEPKHFPCTLCFLLFLNGKWRSLLFRIETKQIEYWLTWAHNECCFIVQRFPIKNIPLIGSILTTESICDVHF